MEKEKVSEKSSYIKLKELILDRHILPGQRMTEVFLAEKMDISRIPVREAIQQLVHEGFIERTGKNGYQIKEYNEQDIIDLYNYREALDGMLARLFTQRMDSSQLYYLEMNVEVMHEKLTDFNQQAFSKIDLEFHRIIARGARNSQMEHQHEIILEKVIYVADNIYVENKEIQKEIQITQSCEKTYRQHLQIFNAIKERDPDKAENSARESVQKGLKKILMVFSRRH